MSEIQHTIKTILSLQSLEYQMLEFLFVPFYMCILQLFNLRQFFFMGSILFKYLFSNSFYPCILSCLVSGIISCILAQIQNICHTNCFSELPERFPNKTVQVHVVVLLLTAEGQGVDGAQSCQVSLNFVVRQWISEIHENTVNMKMDRLVGEEESALKREAPG